MPAYIGAKRNFVRETNGAENSLKDFWFSPQNHLQNYNFATQKSTYFFGFSDYFDWFSHFYTFTGIVPVALNLM